jgi:hypothetical protein
VIIVGPGGQFHRGVLNVLHPMDHHGTAAATDVQHALDTKHVGAGERELVRQPGIEGALLHRPLDHQAEGADVVVMPIRVVVVAEMMIVTLCPGDGAVCDPMVLALVFIARHRGRVRMVRIRRRTGFRSDEVGLFIEPARRTSVLRPVRNASGRP